MRILKWNDKYTYGEVTASDHVLACLTSAIPIASCLSSAQSSSDAVLMSKHLTTLVKAVSLPNPNSVIIQ